jgi:uncharacterized protein (TIGR04255 family)
MARHRHLSKAPLVEALLDIRVAPRMGLTFNDLEPLRAAYGREYAKVVETRTAGLHFELPTGVKLEAIARATAAPAGLMFFDATGKNRVQASLDEFTQNVLAPYADFESLLAKARANWGEYRRVTAPLSITRISLRYVNELRLPRSGEKIEEFLPVIPSIPATLPQGLSDFAFRMTIDNPKIRARAIVNQIFQGTVDESGVQVILDIDAIQERQIPVDDTKLWDSFAELRAFKNDIFFEFVSERLLEKYQ